MENKKEYCIHIHNCDAREINHFCTNNSKKMIGGGKCRNFKAKKENEKVK